MRVTVFLCVIAIAGVFTSGYNIEHDEDIIEGLEEKIEDLEMEMMEDDFKEDETEDEDRIDHDCKTIKAYTEENLKKEPWWKEGRKFKSKKTYKKYNHAYGLMIVGSEAFKDDSMRRACYLMRYIFADNQYMRSMAYKNNFFIVGYGGGFCCPPQMGNQGLSCQCARKIINGKGELKGNGFPFLGKGAPAHEMAHNFIKQILAPMVTADKMKLPEFIDNDKWSYTKPYNENTRDGKESKKCAKATSASKKYGLLWDFLWNSQMQDRLAEPKGTGIWDCKWHHYFIYTGQQRWLFQNGVSRPALRKWFKKRNPNLYNLMETVWPCNNDYTSVCEDGSYGFTKGLAQKFLIGKIDPKDKTKRKMICQDIDKGEIEKTEVKALETPAVDLVDKGKCLRVAREVNVTLHNDLQPNGRGVKVDAFQKYLKTGTEYAWYLRRCCSKTAKFSSAVNNE